MRLECKGGDCGLCCRVTGGDVVVTASEALKLPFDSVIRTPKIIIMKSIQGQCSQLKNARCDCYDARPQGCHEYPWYRIAGVLHFDSGCPGIRFDLDQRPPVETLSDIGLYLPAPKPIQQFLKIIFRLW